MKQRISLAEKTLKTQIDKLNGDAAILAQQINMLKAQLDARVEIIASLETEVERLAHERLAS